MKAVLDGGPDRTCHGLEIEVGLSEAERVFVRLTEPGSGRTFAGVFRRHGSRYTATKDGKPLTPAMVLYRYEGRAEEVSR